MSDTNNTSETKRRVVVFEKGDLLGCMSVADNGQTALVRSYDSRCGIKDAQAVLPSGAAAQFVAAELRTTVERGWRVIYDGEPNFG